MNDIAELKKQWKASLREIKEKQRIKAEAELDKEYKYIEERYFDIQKNLVILAGTIFGSSIALATGRNVNQFFIFGEFCLLLSLISGAILIWSNNSGRESWYFYKRYSHIKVNYDETTPIFLKKAKLDLMDTYENLYKASRNSLIHTIQKIIRIEFLPTIFFTTFFLGCLHILISLL